MKRSLIVWVLAVVLPVGAGTATAEESVSADQRKASPRPEQTSRDHGMPREERAEYRARMRAANTPEERKQIREEYRAAKRAAKNKPDHPPRSQSADDRSADPDKKIEGETRPRTSGEHGQDGHRGN